MRLNFNFNFNSEFNLNLKIQFNFGIAIIGSNWLIIKININKWIQEWDSISFN